MKTGKVRRRILPKRYCQLFERHSIAVFLSTPNGQILDCNDSFARMVGFASREELLGREGWDLYPSPSSREQFLDAIGSQKELRNYKVCYRRKGGGLVWVLLNASLVKGERGKQTLIEGAVVDITKEKRAYAALRRSKARFTAFMNNTPTVAFIRDEEGRYVYVNRAWERRIGRPTSDILGKNPFQIWPSEIATELLENDAAVLADGRPKEFIEKTTLESGEEQEWLAVKFPLHEQGEKRFIGCVSVNVTERHRMEEHLREVQRFEFLGRLVGGVTHDFKNLLTAISGHCQLLREAVEEGNVALKHEEQIRKAADLGAQLTQQLLAYGRRQVLSPEILSIAEVVTGMLVLLKPVLGAGVEVVTDFDPGANRIEADRRQLEEVIMNLAVNARDAMPKGGRLLIGLANVKVDERFARAHRPMPTGQYVRLFVTDSGVGMDKKTLERIFEPFFTTKAEGVGTGLGLATVYGIVKQTGGFIWVESEIDKGTRFDIYFPLGESSLDRIGQNLGGDRYSDEHRD